MNSIKKFATAVAVLALTAGAQAATIPFGTIDSTTDSFQSFLFTPKAGTQSDTFTFTVAEAGEYSFTGQAVTPSGGFAFTGGELTLFGSGAPLKASFDVTGSAVSEFLAVGDYTFEVDGVAAGKKGGRFTVEVASVVPEPTSIALMLAGLGMIGGLARRRRQG